jgi:hypothetical protein
MPMFVILESSLHFFVESNNDTGEKSVRLKIVDMDDIDEDTPQTGQFFSSKSFQFIPFFFLSSNH